MKKAKRVRRPDDIRVSDNGRMDLAEGNIWLIYYIDEVDEREDFHWIEGKQQIKALRTWLGKAIAYLEQTERKGKTR